MNEFAIEWVKGSDYAGVTVPSGTAFKSKLIKLSKNYPDEVKIIAENADGSIFAHVPVSYIKISHTRIVSDENKKAASERFKQMWRDKQGREN